MPCLNPLMTDFWRSTQKSRPNLSRVFYAPSFRLFLRVLMFFMGCSVLTAQAEDAAAFALRGFGTLGATRSNSRNAEFVRDLSQPRGVVDHWSARSDSLLGLQANYAVNRQLELVVQAVSRYRYDKTYTPDITWGYLKFEPTPDISLRAGRLGTEFFMLSDSRLVGYSYLTVRPPGDFFWHLPFYHIDGGDAAIAVPFGEAVVRGKVFAGISHEKVALGEELWNLSGSLMSGVYVDYLNGPWMLRASYSSISFKNNLPIDKTLNAYLPANLAKEGGDYLATAHTRSDYYALGLVYDRGPWQLQLMLNRIEQGSKAFQNSAAGYALAGYRIGAMTPFIGYSQVLSQQRSDTRNAVLAALMADSHAHQETWMGGVRWDVASNVALKVQWDGIRGKPTSIFPFRSENAAWSGKMNVLSATLDFIF